MTVRERRHGLNNTRGIACKLYFEEQSSLLETRHLTQKGFSLPARSSVSHQLSCLICLLPEWTVLNSPSKRAELGCYKGWFPLRWLECFPKGITSLALSKEKAREKAKSHSQRPGDESSVCHFPNILVSGCYLVWGSRCLQSFWPFAGEPPEVLDLSTSPTRMSCKRSCQGTWAMYGA